MSLKTKSKMNENGENIKNYSFEEFKLMYDSAEKVTERRIANNKFNYSVSTAIFIAITIIWKWSLTNETYEYAGVFVALILSIIATIFTFHWIEQIKSFKSLNNAKFEVINEMGKSLFFASETSGIEIESFQPFTKEWKILKDKNALQENNNMITLKSTDSEYFIPKSFRVIFILLSVLSILTIILNFSSFYESIKSILVI